VVPPRPEPTPPVAVAARATPTTTLLHHPRPMASSHRTPRAARPPRAHRAHRLQKGTAEPKGRVPHVSDGREIRRKRTKGPKGHFTHAGALDLALPAHLVCHISESGKNVSVSQHCWLINNWHF
jgi:hypothetical protein